MNKRISQPYKVMNVSTGEKDNMVVADNHCLASMAILQAPLYLVDGMKQRYFLQNIINK